MSTNNQIIFASLWMFLTKANELHGSQTSLLLLQITLHLVLCWVKSDKATLIFSLQGVISSTGSKQQFMAV